VCAAPSCPALLQADCTSWLGEVADTIPSVIFSAKVDNENVFDVTVSMDGQSIASQLDGRPIEVDPGLHIFVFEHAGAPPITKKTIVGPREKSQVLSVVWASPANAAPSAAPSLSPEPTAKARPIPPLFYVLTGTTVVGFGTFAIVGLLADSTKHDLEQSCSPHCSHDEVNSLKTRFIVADVAAAVGAASAAGALVVLLTRPEVERAPRAGVTSIGVLPVARGAALELAGRF
jgi:hypothetical protein